MIGLHVAYSNPNPQNKFYTVPVQQIPKCSAGILACQSGHNIINMLHKKSRLRFICFNEFDFARVQYKVIYYPVSSFASLHIQIEPLNLE